MIKTYLKIFLYCSLAVQDPGPWISETSLDKRIWRQPESSDFSVTSLKVTHTLLENCLNRKLMKFVLTLKILFPFSAKWSAVWL